MRTYTLLFSALVLVACGDGSTPTNQPDVIVAPDADTSGGDATPDTAGDVPGDTDAGDPDGDGGADAADAADTSETGGDADATTELPDTTGDADVTPEVTDCASLADACDKANDVRCAPSGPVTAQQCVLKDGCLQWLDAEVCEENNLCTGKPDLCVDGACAPDGDPDASCDTPVGECMANLCDSATGNCQLQTGGDFESCDDNNACTDSDICFDGSCTGELSCPKACNVDSLICNDVHNFALSNGGTQVMNSYGCEGADAGYGGFEQSLQLSNKSGSTCTDFEVAVELADPKKKGTDFADVFLLNKTQGICWPADCAAAAQMDANGRALLPASLAVGQEYIVVVDGRESFSGEVRVVANCCGGNPRELFCGNDVDDDGDGVTDCDDPDCSDDPAGGIAKICTFEQACGDGLDNDNDGDKDCSDADCVKAPACTTEASCGDSIDDDGDGLTDCEDPACKGSLDCGGGCVEATVLQCGVPLLGQTMAANGVNTFTDVPIPACGESSRPTPYEGKHSLYLASVPSGCTGNVVIDYEDSGAFVDAYVFGPGCDVDSCQTSKLFLANFNLPVDKLATNWIMLADFAGGFQTTMKYDIELQCVCP